MALKFATEEQYKAFINHLYDRLYLDNSLEIPVVNPAWFTEDCELSEAEAINYIEVKYNADDLTDSSILFVRAIVRKILLYTAYEREDFAEMPEGVAAGYNQAMARLLDIRDGKSFLSVNTEEVIEEGEEGEQSPYYFSGNEPIFNGDEI